MAKRTKASFAISAIAEQFQVHPQTLRLYEREGLLKPSRSVNARLYTEDDVERLEVILNDDLGVNLAGGEIILMRWKMEEMQHQIEEFVPTLNTEIAQRGRTTIADLSHSRFRCWKCGGRGSRSRHRRSRWTRMRIPALTGRGYPRARSQILSGSVSIAGTSASSIPTEDPFITSAS